MSENVEFTETAPRARDVERCAAEWLARQDRSELSNDDRQTFDAWMQASLAHRVAYWRLDAAWSRSKRLVALRPMMPLRTKLPERSQRKRNLGRWSVLLATVACVGLSVTFFFQKSTAQTFATGFAGHKALKLADGSTIELNTDTTVRVAVTAQSRTVWLDKGEAYFHVKHDADHVFTVISGDRSITDLGTEFSIRRDPARLTVAVVHGRVLFDTVSRAKTPSVLTEGDTAVVAGNALSITRNTWRKLADRSAWRHGMLIFDQALLSDAAAEFNRYNTKKIVIRDARAGQRTIGATFPIHDVDEFVDVAEEVLKLRVQKRGNEIVISR